MLMIPSLTTVSDQAFLADDTLIGGYELGGGWLRAERVKVGKRAFVGNSAMAAPGRKVPKRSLVAVLSAAPARGTVKAGKSWLGSPPAPLRRAEQGSADERTYAPPRRLKVARACWEIARVVPLALAVALHVAVVAGTLAVWSEYGAWVGLVAVPVLLWAAGAVAALVAIAAKWLLVGKVRAGSHPLWSSFVWRNELADTFIEVLATPWFAGLATGSPLITLWFKAMGARVGRGVWCESYWLPEADLVELGDGATVEPGQRRADPSLPRPVARHRRGAAAPRRDARAQLGGAACGHAGQARYRRAGVIGDEGRDGPGQDAVDRQPDRAVGRVVRDAPIAHR